MLTQRIDPDKLFQLQWYLCLALIPIAPLLIGVAIGVLICRAGS